MPENDRRTEDLAIANLTRMVTEQGIKLDTMKEGMHKLEIHMAELMASNTGRLDRMSDRLDRLEGNQKTFFNAITGIIMTLVTAVVVWVVQQWGGSAVAPK